MTSSYRDGTADLMSKIKLEPCSISSLNSGRVSRLASSLVSAPQLTGAIDKGIPTLVGTVVPDYLPSKSLKNLLSGRGARPNCILYAWTDCPPLPVVTFTLFIDTFPLRVVLPSGSQAITKQRREFIWVLFKQHLAVGAIRVVLDDHRLDDYLEDAMNILASPANDIIAGAASFWAAGQVRAINQVLSDNEKLQVSWSNCYAQALSLLAESSHESLPTDIDALSPFLREFLSRAIEVGFCAPVMYNWLVDRGPLLKGIMDINNSIHDFRTFCHARTEHRHCGILGFLLHCIILDPRLTDYGLKIPFVGLDGVIERLSTNPALLKSQGLVDDYWSRIPDALLFRLGSVASENDVLCDLSGKSEIWSQLPRVANPKECLAAAQSLLEEAVAHKQWAIPPKALVQLPLGPFTEFEVTEIALNGFTEVHFVGKTKGGEICPVVIEPSAGFISVPHRSVVEGTFDDIEASIFLPLAAVLRDFWVAEQREHIFSNNYRGASSPRLASSSTDERIVYLPRVRYTSTPDLERLSRDLPTLPRGAHQVREHLRKVNHPSPSQVALASLFNVSVPVGYTFVRPHQRGLGETTIRYRSRSALKCLYQETESRDVTQTSDWFLFEKKVKEWLESIGYEAIWNSVARNGDNGIDVSASRRVGNTEHLLVAQCKCYSPNRPVGPAVVRELIGAIAACPTGTQGIIATTSYATEAALELARQHNIIIVTGDQWIITNGQLGYTL